MRWLSASCLVAALIVVAWGARFGRLGAEDAPKDAGAPRFREGSFQDAYFGVTYRAAGLKESPPYAAMGRSVIWAGEADGDVFVQILCEESPAPQAADVWRRAALKGASGVAAPEQIEQGSDPMPWVTFVRVGISGYRRHHGYAFHVRDHQCVQVHAQVLEASKASSAALRTYLGGLQVDAKSACFVRAYEAGRRMAQPPTAPAVLLQAGLAYLEEPPRIPTLALQALRKASARRDTLDADQRWLLAAGLGSAEFALNHDEAAVKAWTQAMESAKAANEPEVAAQRAAYNLACALARLGRAERALEALRKAFAAGDPGHAAYLREHAVGDPDLKSLRADPRWLELLDEGPTDK